MHGDALDVEGETFSELDARLMVQLLQCNARLTRVDLSGTRPLPREIRVLADGLGRVERLPLTTLCVNGRLLGLEACAALLEPLRGCPLEALELRKAELCGVRATGREPFSTYVLEMICGLIARAGGGLRRLHLQVRDLP